MLEYLAGIDVLGLGMLIGSLLFLGALLWVLLDNRSFSELNEVKDEEAPKGGTGTTPSERAPRLSA